MSDNMSENADNTELLQILREIRKEMRDHRTLLLEALAQGRSLEVHVDAQLLALDQRVKELKDELEQMIKSELMGFLDNSEIRGSDA
jgi:hypothetical protein